MSKYIMLAGSIILIILSFVYLNRLYAPKIGPIGNGPSEQLILYVWITFIVTLVTGIMYLIRSIIMIVKSKKNN